MGVSFSCPHHCMAPGEDSLPPPQILVALEAFKIGSNLAFMPSYTTIKDLNDLRRETHPIYLQGGGGAGTTNGNKRGGDNDGERAPK